MSYGTERGDARLLLPQSEQTNLTKSDFWDEKYREWVGEM